MEFIITSATADTERKQELRDITNLDSPRGWKETIPGPRLVSARICIEVVSTGDFSKLWEMTKTEADEYVSRAILEKIQTIEI